MQLMETPIEETSATSAPDDERPFVRASIDAATARLAPGARAVFVLHDVEGYTHEEIAATLGITAGGSKSQLFKARLRMRRMLAHLVGPDDGLPTDDVAGADASRTTPGPRPTAGGVGGMGPASAPAGTAV
jgi:Sigma-70, region 4